MSDLTPYNNEAPKKNLLFVTQLVYILHGLSIVIGLMTGATIISAFLFGWPSIAAVILNYIMAPDARGDFSSIALFLANPYFLVRHDLDSFGGYCRRFVDALCDRSLYLVDWLCGIGNLGGLSHCGGLVATASISTGIL